MSTPEVFCCHLQATDMSRFQAGLPVLMLMQPQTRYY